LDKSILNQEPFVPYAARQGSIMAMWVTVWKPATDNSVEINCA